MIRSFVILLLFAVFFLSGTLYGLDRAETEVRFTETEERTAESAEDKDPLFEEKNHDDKGSGDYVPEIQQGSFMQYAASFLEAGVKGIYDGIVHILYQFAQLFF
jgi:hypothetical protein